MTSLPRSVRPLLPLLLLLVVALAYWPGLSGGFIFDDHNNIQINPRIQIDSLDLASLSRAARAYEPGAYGRPLSTLSFALDHYFHGKHPYGYKLTSLAVHLFNTLLVFLLAARLLALPRAGGPWTPWAALAIATAWASHPLQVSTVLYIVQRMEMLAATFVLLALLAYLQGRLRQMRGERGGLWLAASGLLAGMGLLAKESAILFPAFALMLEFTLLGFEARSERLARGLRWAYAGATLAAAVLFFGYVVPRFAPAESFAGRDFTVGERLLTQLRILPMHLGQMLLPLPDSLPFYYDNYPKSTGWLSPWTTLGGGLLLASLAALAWFLRRRAPIVTFGIGWFFAAHALTSGPLNLEMAFEHRNYLALFGIVVAAADVIRRLPTRDGPALKVFAVVVVVAMFGVLTTIRSATWGHPLLLATDLVARNPQSPRASNDLATTYVDMSDGSVDSPFLHLGMQEFERGSRLPGASPLPEQGLILMAAVSGYPTDPAWWDRLIDKVRTQPIGPQQAMAVNGLLSQHKQGIKLDARRLAEAYQALLDRQPWPGHVYAYFADFVLADLQDEAWAERLYLQAVSRDPTDSAFANLVLSNLIVEGHGRQAEAVMRRMRELGLTDAAPPTPSDAR
ncbi:hypothetical protein [Arenimonas terrae]|jgi:hypothetical protein|uniref:Tetratricopeptide repeat protein n=1 Tax=Arenimonas terrae TaxID=2546226 RepID=A0A5C4RW50_9GAMM|nr:hypothetical protein [Arenimonas terrae]TNJ35486.1 hypothetical protein E1B00_06960 [Arenimonas terrae]